VSSVLVGPRASCTFGNVFRQLPAAPGHCYLTFDDGPDPRTTPAVLHALAAARARASFFVIGRLARTQVALLRAAHAAGHAIGNHGWEHAHAWTLTRARAHREVHDGADAIAQVLGARPEWYRPPHGRLSPYVIEAVRSEEQQIALWNRSAVDWGPLATPRRILNRLRRIQAGDIVLLHDGRLRHNRPDQSVRVLPVLLALLAREATSAAALPRLVTMSG
jgi:peptidoglycan/xylan/chitin deacetylase (PgdA/CDA1 family)